MHKNPLILFLYAKNCLKSLQAVYSIKTRKMRLKYKKFENRSRVKVVAVGELLGYVGAKVQYITRSVFTRQIDFYCFIAVVSWPRRGARVI